MADGIAARYVLSCFGPRPSALERITSIGLDLPVRGHGERLSKLGSLCTFDPPIVLGRGCVFSQRTRPAAVGSIPVPGPPRGFIAMAMDFAMVPPTEWDRKLIADLASER
jgi:hypothetical protein